VGRDAGGPPFACSCVEPRLDRCATVPRIARSSSGSDDVTPVACVHVRLRAIRDRSGLTHGTSRRTRDPSRAIRDRSVPLRHSSRTIQRRATRFHARSHTIRDRSRRSRRASPTIRRRAARSMPGHTRSAARHTRSAARHTRSGECQDFCVWGLGVSRAIRRTARVNPHNLRSAAPRSVRRREYLMASGRATVISGGDLRPARDTPPRQRPGTHVHRERDGVRSADRRDNRA
jgi:hypothetical protein